MTKRTSKILVTSILALLFSSCIPTNSATPNNDDSTADNPTTPTASVTDPVERQLTLKYRYNNAINSNMSYTIWIENTTDGYLQPIYTTPRVVKNDIDDITASGVIGGLADADSLPYWHVKKFPDMDIDEVTYTTVDTDGIDVATSATIKKHDFNVKIANDYNIAHTTMTRTDCATADGGSTWTGECNINVKLSEDRALPRQFSIYFEFDFSFNTNDWFPSNQPATLFKADIDLDATGDYALSFVGWTPSSNSGSNGNVLTTARGLALIADDINSGDLQTELGYITKLNNAGAFGASDARAQINIIQSLVLTVE